MLVTSNERIGSALNSKNLKSDELHSDADVIAALAFANRLGISLQHIRSGGHINSATTAVSQLSVTLKRACKRKRMGISNEAAARCAEQALREWLVGICRTCNGTGERLMDYSGTAKKRIKGVCPHCGGSGAFMPLWSWRRSVMRITGEMGEDWWVKRLELAHEVINDAYRSAQRKVSQQMREIQKT